MKNAARQTKADRYLKVVEWSEADGCFVGRCRRRPQTSATAASLSCASRPIRISVPPVLRP